MTITGAPPSVLSDIFPSRGKIGLRFGFRQFSAVASGIKCWKLAAGGGAPISPLEGEMSDRTEGGAPVKRKAVRS
jgi:cobaltochelatase CobN